MLPVTRAVWFQNPITEKRFLGRPQSPPQNWKPPRWEARCQAPSHMGTAAPSAGVGVTRVRTSVSVRGRDLYPSSWHRVSSLGSSQSFSLTPTAALGHIHRVT